MDGEDIFNDPELEELMGDLVEQHENNENLDPKAMEKLTDKLFADPLMREMLQAGIKRGWTQQNLVEGLEWESQYPIIINLLNSGYMPFVEEIERYMEKEDVKEIHTRVEDDFEKNTVSDELRNRYDHNLTPVEEEVNGRIADLKRRIMGDKYGEIQEIKSSDLDDKEEIIQQIEESYRTEKHKPLWEKIERLESEYSRISRFPYTESETTYNWEPVDGDETRHLKHISIRIYNPRLYTRLHQFEPEYKEYPLQWLDFTIGRDRHLFNFFKDDEDIEQAILSRVNSDGYFDEFIDNLTKIPSYRNREDLLEEIPTAFSCDLYGSVINLVLPQIEYLMWQYAAFIDSKGSSEILDIEYDEIWNFDYREHDKLKITNSNGNVNESPTVGALVEDTDLSTHLTPRLVRYFGDELFSDRNPILHGNSDDYYSELEAAKKIVFLNRVAEQLVDTITKMYADEITNKGVFDDTDLPMDLFTEKTNDTESD